MLKRWWPLEKSDLGARSVRGQATSESACENGAETEQ